MDAEYLCSDVVDDGESWYREEGAVSESGRGYGVDELYFPGWGNWKNFGVFNG